MILKIGTLNIKNDKENRYNENNSKAVANYIKDEDFDILGTQELTRLITKRIKKCLNSHKMYGGYRFGSNLITKYIKFIDIFNENNNVITKHKVIKNKTKILPFIPHSFKDFVAGFKKHIIFPRIATILLIDINGEIICFINTHLDYKIEDIQVRQLKKIEKIIKKYSNYKIFMTGDFNSQITNDNFKKFCLNLEKYNLKRVEINEKTNSNRFKSKNAIDHIFIPTCCDIISMGTKDIDLTDHKGLYVEVNYG